MSTDNPTSPTNEQLDLLDDFSLQISTRRRFITPNELEKYKSVLHLNHASSGLTPIQLAIQMSEANTLILLLDNFEEARNSLKNVKSSKQPYTNWTAAMFAACETSNPKIWQYVAKYTTKEDALFSRNDEGETLISVLARRGSNKALRWWLFEHGDDYDWNLKLGNKNGHTPLMIAAALGKLSVVDTLIEYARSQPDPDSILDLNQRDKANGDTACHFSMQIHMKRLVEDLGDEDYSILYRLVKCGASLHVRSRDGLTPLEFCDDDIIPLFNILSDSPQHMPDHLEQLLNVPRTYIESMSFIPPSDRENLLKSLECIRIERQEEEQLNATSSCPVVSGKRKKKSTNQHEEVEDESNCPFLKKKNTEKSNSNSKCPVPMAESLYSVLSNKSFWVGFGVSSVIGAGTLGVAFLFSRRHVQFRDQQ